MIDWPPPYTIRHSARTRRISLRITEESGLEIVVPKRQKTVNAEALLKQHRAWIEANYYLLQKHAITKLPPSQLSLKAIGEHWDIAYLPQTGKNRSCRTYTNNGLELVISCDINNHSECQQLLNNWLKRKALHHFTPWLETIAEETGLNYNQLRIQLQKTRWGSCSSGKTISLNAKLLLLNPDYVRMVMVHELCHTIHLNHSTRFWSLVEQFIPNYRTLNNELKQIMLPI